MEQSDIIGMARKTLDTGLYRGNGHITNATDAELICFAKDIRDATIMEIISTLKEKWELTDQIYVINAIHRIRDAVQR